MIYEEDFKIQLEKMEKFRSKIEAMDPTQRIEMFDKIDEYTKAIYEDYGIYFDEECGS